MTYDVVIVGAGVMGSAAAYWLSRAGKRVALLEKHEPAHVGAASGDHSRKVRYQYQGQDIYTEMVAEAVKLWNEFESSVQRTRSSICRPQHTKKRRRKEKWAQPSIMDVCCDVFCSGLFKIRPQVALVTCV